MRGLEVSMTTSELCHLKIGEKWPVDEEGGREAGQDSERLVARG